MAVESQRSRTVTSGFRRIVKSRYLRCLTIRGFERKLEKSRKVYVKFAAIQRICYANHPVYFRNDFPEVNGLVMKFCLPKGRVLDCRYE